ncbi:hypothetical protein MGYG_05073 [Nannizzia gypsea CBS 118893]|uniref:Yeast cell wall synthesis Kre9/Knh1-like N-terminal domain-containing protein n=1 Tax=Arthroderma gypseum (strain ATCC MYA-4604 / CBS 118893) TaxID=535722 RepID=E4UYA7_ARTGP|nr:hypothetical protein MGYG_05073 [Nannizzia gypsea CBS 118893]EFR02070.1 hypothetical protein MGYG_05073 [Nannizzia gypsea CBS 118893]
MRSVLYLAFAALAAAASMENPFLVPPGGYHFSAQQPTTLNWKPTTSGTVTLKLQMGTETTPKSGVVLGSNLPNSGSFSFVPKADMTEGGIYTIQILDDENPDNYNFTPTFTVDGATGSPTSGPTTTRASMTTSEATTTDDSTSSSSRSTTRSATTTTDSSSSESTTMTTVTSSSSSSTTTDSTSASETESSTSSSSTGMPTGGAPDPNGAVSLALPGGLLSLVFTLMALL